MTFIEALIYGVIQGVTEFLPVSSSGHLVLLPWFLGWEDPGLAFDVALHWGTLFGVVVYFRKDLLEIIRGWFGSFTGKRDPINILPWQIGVATVPAAMAGFFLEKQAESIFRSPWVIAGTLAGVAILLFLSDRLKKDRTELSALTWTQALLIGCAQAFAIVPGVSRSGITMTAALFLSLNRSGAVRFSFLLSIPIILGAGILELGYFVKSIGNPVFLTGILAAALSGYAAISFLVHYVREKSFTPFVIYRIALAAIIIGKILTR